MNKIKNKNGTSKGGLSFNNIIIKTTLLPTLNTYTTVYLKAWKNSFVLGEAVLTNLETPHKGFF